MLKLFILVDGKPVICEDPLQWGEWMAEADTVTERSVAFTKIGDGEYVSTVFLGIDHGYGDESAPLLYETLISEDGSMSRYATREEAEIGHQLAVRRAMELRVIRRAR